jgi:hypothetical protein
MPNSFLMGLFILLTQFSKVWVPEPVKNTSFWLSGALSHNIRQPHFTGLAKSRILIYMIKRGYSGDAND